MGLLMQYRSLELHMVSPDISLTRATTATSTRTAPAAFRAPRGPARRAEQRAQLIFERRAAALADRTVEEVDAAPGGCREPAGRRGLAAVQRLRREDQVERAA